MSRSTFLSLFFFGLFVFSLHAQDHLKPYEDYIRKYTPLAMTQQVIYGIPSSITLAQGILESNAGKSNLAKKSNNHFGIKCHNDWTGITSSHFDDGEMCCFRKYPKIEDSYKDHSLFLTKKPRYASLFELKIKNYKGWAKGLKKAGYATDRHYDKKLISIIKLYELNKYDKLASKKRRAKKIIRNWEKDYPEELALVETPGTQKPEQKRNKKETKETAPAKSKREEIKKDQTRTRLAEKAKDYNLITEASREKNIERNERNERTDNLPQVINAAKSHTIFYKGLAPYLVAQYGDNFDNISDEFGLSPQRIKKLNEWPPNYRISVGDIIFLSKKALSWDGKEAIHLVKDGDSMHSISQRYGLQVKALYEINAMEIGSTIQVGQVLKLKTQE